MCIYRATSGSISRHWPSKSATRRHKKDLVKIVSKVIFILMSSLLLFKLKF